MFDSYTLTLEKEFNVTMMDKDFKIPFENTSSYYDNYYDSQYSICPTKSGLPRVIVFGEGKYMMVAMAVPVKALTLYFKVIEIATGNHITDIIRDGDLNHMIYEYVQDPLNPECVYFL